MSTVTFTRDDAEGLISCALILNAILGDHRLEHAEFLLDSFGIDDDIVYRIIESAKVDPEEGK